MTTPDPTEQAVYNQFWGGAARPAVGAPPAAPADAIVMYDGAQPKWFKWASLPNGGWWTWDLRSTILTFVHDLLRVQVPTPPSGVSGQPYGLRDSINTTLFLAEQNNAILRAIAKQTGTDISAIITTPTSD
jgi:hypothetical protein